MRFWAKSFAFFGSGYYETMGRLRDTTGAHAYIYTHEDTSSIVALTLNPNDPTRVFGAIRDPIVGKGDTVYFYWTSDGAENWNYSNMVADVDPPIQTLVPHSASASLLRLFASTPKGVYSSTNQGVSWTAFNQDSLEGKNVLSLAKSPYGISTTFTLYAGTDNGIWKRLSTPGQKWTRMATTGLTDSLALSIAAHPVNRDTVYIGTAKGFYMWSPTTSNWISLYSGLPDTITQTISVDPTNGSRIMVGTPVGFYLTTNGGVDWNSKSNGLTQRDVRAIVIEPTNPSILYAGTWGGGVFKSTDGGDNWTAMNNGFPIHQFGHFVSSLVVDPVSSNNVYAGTKRGVFKSTDGGASWTEKNLGFFKSYILNETLDSLLVAFESRIPADSTKGIYETTINLLGDPPDVDGDPKIYIYVLDILDLLGDGTQGSYKGFFDPIHENTNADTSNKKEVLFVDAYPLDVTSSSAHQALTHQFALMVLWNGDKNETKWVTEGIAGYSEFKHGYVDTTASFLFPSGNNLTFWGDGTASADGDHSYLWTMYLYEKYGGENTIKNIAIEPKNGFEGVDRVLASQGYSERHIQIYSDWIIACYLDLPNPAFYSGKYGFSNLNVFCSKDWLQPGLTADFPYFLEIPAWGTRYYFMYYQFISPGAMPDSFLLFNGENPNRFSVQILKLDTIWTDPPGEGSVVIPYSLNQWNEGSLYVGDFKNGTFPSLAMAVSVVSDTGTMDAPFVIEDDMQKPSYVRLAVVQNAQADRFLDLYVFTNERLYKDVSQETPVVGVTQNNTTRQVPMAIFSEPGTDSISVIYKGDFTLSASGNVEIVLTGEDAAGNDIVPETTGVSVRSIQSDEGGEISSIEGNMHLSLPPKSLFKDTYLTVFTLESSLDPQGLGSSSPGTLLTIPVERKPLGFGYRIGPEGLQLKRTAELTIQFEESIHPDPSQIGIYRQDGETWIYVGGVLNERSISTEIDRLGTYQIHSGPHPPLSPLPRVYSLSQNVPNPMDRESRILYQLPRKAFVSLKIYNIAGQLVKTLVKEEENAGYKSVTWTREDDHGREVSNGVYFYTFEAQTGQTLDFKNTKKLVILK